MNEVTNAMQQKTVAQFLIMFIVLSTICGMYLMGKDVPPTLLSIAFVIIGFYFGSSSAANDINKAAQAISYATTNGNSQAGK